MMFRRHLPGGPQTSFRPSIAGGPRPPITPRTVTVQESEPSSNHLPEVLKPAYEDEPPRHADEEADIHQQKEEDEGGGDTETAVTIRRFKFSPLVEHHCSSALSEEEEEDEDECHTPFNLPTPLTSITPLTERQFESGVHESPELTAYKCEALSEDFIWATLHENHDDLEAEHATTALTRVAEQASSIGLPNSGGMLDEISSPEFECTPIKCNADPPSSTSRIFTPMPTFASPDSPSLESFLEDLALGDPPTTLKLLDNDNGCASPQSSCSQNSPPSHLSRTNDISVRNPNEKFIPSTEVEVNEGVNHSREMSEVTEVKGKEAKEILVKPLCDSSESPSGTPAALLNPLGSLISLTSPEAMSLDCFFENIRSESLQTSDGVKEAGAVGNDTSLNSPSTPSLCCLTCGPRSKDQVMSDVQAGLVCLSCGSVIRESEGGVSIGDLSFLDLQVEDYTTTGGRSYVSKDHIIAGNRDSRVRDGMRRRETIQRAVRYRLRSILSKNAGRRPLSLEKLLDSISEDSVCQLAEKFLKTYRRNHIAKTHQLDCVVAACLYITLFQSAAGTPVAKTGLIIKENPSEVKIDKSEDASKPSLDGVGTGTSTDYDDVHSCIWPHLTQVAVG
eukprot:GHVN01011256.1.p1 GENE.GHVN01011256.1~~GHVN01011256.1.p1  ORF type:complete len:619 (-),score=147.18 GHVN01011256.1:512-2368(-)